jgi:ferritin-like metal-binding protein YciE
LVAFEKHCTAEQPGLLGDSSGTQRRFIERTKRKVSDEQRSLQAYVSDMLALERHVRIPFEAQAKDDDFSKYPQSGALVQQILDQSKRHIDALETTLQELGGNPADPVKSAVSQVEGFFAGAIDMMRKTKVSKGLRDDYTALALCTAGYTLLQTTAMALGNSTVAQQAQRNLTDYAQSVMAIGQALPEVALRELSDIGIDVATEAATAARQAAKDAWQPHATTTTGVI